MKIRKTTVYLAVCCFLTIFSNCIATASIDTQNFKVAIIAGIIGLISLCLAIPLYRHEIRMQYEGLDSDMDKEFENLSSDIEKLYKELEDEYRKLELRDIERNREDELRYREIRGDI